jgi:hypothetical protein
MANRADLKDDLTALRNLIEQAYLVVSSDPIPPGGRESCRENLEAALVLSNALLEMQGS